VGQVSDCIFFACFPPHRLEYITEDTGVEWALPYSSATRVAQFQGSQASVFAYLHCDKRCSDSLQGDEITDIVKEMEALPPTSKLRRWLSMVLRRQGQLAPADGRRSSGNAPLASPRPSDDPSAIRMQTPRKLAAVSPVKSVPVRSPRSDNATSNVAVKSSKAGNAVGLSAAPKLTPRRAGQDVDPKILQMAAHAASLRPSTTKSDISSGDVGVSIAQGGASSAGDSTAIETPHEGQKEKRLQPPLPPHALPPPHAHRKPNIRDRKNEGV
jgi:hypothetical protein